MDCELCEQKATIGHPNYRWNGPERTHCNDCHASWRMSSNAAHCVICHVTFGSPAGFDEHQWGSGCATPQALGMEPKPNKWGTDVWWIAEDLPEDES